MTKKNIALIKQIIIENYQNAETELNYTNDYELLVAITLSAQCTDKRVNIVTKNLFEDYPGVKELSCADVDEIKEYIKTCSFYNNKAVNIVKMANSVMNDFGGEIPQTQKELVTLAGVGQKTANVFLGEYHNQNFMAVDTHVFRLSHRLKLSKAKTVEQTEKDLEVMFKTDLNLLHQAMVLHGRYVCKAQKPQCFECVLSHLCTSKDKVI